MSLLFVGQLGCDKVDQYHTYSSMKRPFCSLVTRTILHGIRTYSYLMPVHLTMMTYLTTGWWYV